MPIPKTRKELEDLTRTNFQKLSDELAGADPRVGDFHCVDDWTVKDLLAVRTWWTERVIDWVEAGTRGERPVTPAEGYKWNETPRLNADIVKTAESESYESIVERLERGFDRVMHTIDQLDDRELLEAGVFAWAGNYPISRWISINTARQYATARTFVRRALRNQESR